jgi:hypothetical protein
LAIIVVHLGFFANATLAVIAAIALHSKILQDIMTL